MYDGQCLCVCTYMQVCKGQACMTVSASVCTYTQVCKSLKSNFDSFISQALCILFEMVFLTGLTLTQWALLAGKPQGYACLCLLSGSHDNGMAPCPAL